MAVSPSLAIEVLIVGASLFLSGSAQAQLWDAATERVGQMFERDRYTASEMQRARAEAHLTKERVELERKTQLLVREYVSYNANVTAYLNYNFAKSPSAELYLPVPAGLIDPNATGLFIPAECYPSSSVSTADNNNQFRQSPTLAPAFQPGYAPSESIQQQSYPPAAPQPTGSYNPGSRDNNGLQLNGNQTPVNYYNPQFLQPNYVPSTAQQPVWRP